MAGRPIQVSATISALLADPRWKRLVDADRIGVPGFSAGGYTSLLVVGAEPRFDRFLSYCERHPGDAGTCGLVEQLGDGAKDARSEEHTSELQSLMRISYVVLCLKQQKKN